MIEYRIGKVAEVEVEGVKSIQVPVSITKQIGIKHNEQREAVPIVEGFGFSIVIPVTDLPSTDRKKFVEAKVKEAYQKYLLEQNKYEDLNGLSFSETEQKEKC